VRSLVEGDGGGFLLVYVATPLEVCEARDRKGLYAKAREGLLPAFTGLTDPYEPPSDADLVIDMTSCSSEQAATTILRRLRNDGYLAAMPDGFTGTEGPEHLSVMA
jgi:sulfate adenylyltransferase